MERFAPQECLLGAYVSYGEPMEWLQLQSLLRAFHWLAPALCRLDPLDWYGT